jgi:preprotein translocase subunit SecA
MVTTILSKVFGTKHDREMKRIQPIVDQINALEPQMQALTDDQLKAQTPKLKERLAKGETLDDILPEAFATCREASKRTLGMRHYDVQLIGGYVLHKGAIAEMRTGEGKTLVATLPVYLNALSGKGVHVVSVNDYLVRRDCEWMSRLYNWLGLTSGVIVHGLNDEERKANYNADITYCTNNELGFDYLRDNMKFDLKDYVQREHNFAIVDECDSILIDEARTPLIISGPAEASTDKYSAIDEIIPKLQRDVHFTIEEKSKSASLTEEGNSKVEQLLGLENLYDAANIETLHHVYQALKAHHLYRRDVEYMIKDGEVVIVDEFTGRLMPGRRWSDGLHQAIEAKEKVEVKNENQTLATITFQNFFRMYNKLSGMTGTADTEALEFKKIYNLDVVVIPTNKPIARKDQDDVVYKTVRGKYGAIAKDVKERYEKGQPVLIGTVSIEKSEALSAALKKEGIRHDVLNAKHHEREAEIVAQAGRKGAITIATNMAGRGTDIVLGGNPEVMAKKATSQEMGPEYEEALAKYKKQCEEEKKHVVSVGGLYIVGTERHESRRIDNQLRGRSGRQGDPGESRFYLSLEDDLMRIFNGERMQKIMDMLKMDENEAITHKMVSRSIESAQRKVEGHHFDIRKNLIEYDDVMNQQRKNIYQMRREILEGKDLEKTFREMLSDVVSNLLDTYAPEKVKIEAWNPEALNNSLNQFFGFKIDFNKTPMQSERVAEEVSNQVKAVYERQKTSMGPFFEQILKEALLRTIDQRWKEHLLVIDKLKEGIHLRGYGQKDPLIEYKKEAFAAFQNLHQAIRSDTVEMVMKVQVTINQASDVINQFRPEETDLTELDYQGGEDTPMGITAGMNGNGNGNGARRQEEPQRGRMRMGPPQDMPERQLNRAERRRMEKDNRKR